MGPGHFVDGVKIPFWVAPGDFDRWIQWDELHRAAYYYVQEYQGIETLRNLKAVKYEELVAEPERITEDVAKSLGLDFGSKPESTEGHGWTA